MIHNHAAVLAVLAAAGVLLAVYRPDRAAGTVYVTRRSPVVAGLGILFAGAPAVIYARRHQAPAPPAARPSTVTHTITRYIPLHNWPVSGPELTLLGLAAIAAAVLIIRLIGRYFGR